MLAKIRFTTKNMNDQEKHWFQDNYFDLFIWQDAAHNIHGFQLCYDRNKRERVVVWDKKRGFSHLCVDDGERSPHKNMTPMFTVCDLPPNQTLIPRFEQAAQLLPAELRTFIVKKLHEYQHYHHSEVVAD